MEKYRAVYRWSMANDDNDGSVLFRSTQQGGNMMPTVEPPPPASGVAAGRPNSAVEMGQMPKP